MRENFRRHRSFKNFGKDPIHAVATIVDLLIQACPIDNPDIQAVLTPDVPLIGDPAIEDDQNVEDQLMEDDPGTDPTIMNKQEDIPKENFKVKDLIDRNLSTTLSCLSIHQWFGVRAISNDYDYASDF